QPGPAFVTFDGGEFLRQLSVFVEQTNRFGSIAVFVFDVAFLERAIWIKPFDDSVLPLLGFLSFQLSTVPEVSGDFARLVEQAISNAAVFEVLAIGSMRLAFLYLQEFFNQPVRVANLNGSGELCIDGCSRF